MLSNFIRKLFGPIPKNKLPRFMYRIMAFLWFLTVIYIVVNIFNKAYTGFGLVINLVFLFILFPLLVRVILDINGKIMNWEFDKDAK